MEAERNYGLFLHLAFIDPVTPSGNNYFAKFAENRRFCPRGSNAPELSAQRKAAISGNGERSVSARVILAAGQPLRQS